MLPSLLRAGPVESIQDLVARQEMSHVAEGMKLLPDEQRTAIVLKEYHGLTFQEIADLQGCPQHSQDAPTKAWCCGAIWSTGA
jgi:DNA-directed RNA polymerase specialized sigma24 family protein